MSTVRLHKLIAQSGICSRRAAEELIRLGKVTVNGKTVTAMGIMVDPGTDSISVDGTPLGSAERKRTYLLNKPAGFLCTRDDPHGRPTVFDILPEEVGTGLHTAGRLDMDAEGLLILTNDGDLTRRLTHPSSHVSKTYLVKVRGEVRPNALKKLRRGVELDDGPTLPASVTIVKGKGTERNTWLRIVMREGRKNQIKRMGEAVGHRVLAIKRVAAGALKLPDKMKPGSFRKLSKKEIESLTGGREKPARSPAPSDRVLRKSQRAGSDAGGGRQRRRETSVANVKRQPGKNTSRGTGQRRQNKRRETPGSGS